MGNNLKKLRESRGWTHQQAADHMGVSRGQFIKLERDERRLTADYIADAARAFGVPEIEIIREKEAIPVVGWVGASSETYFFPSNDGPFDEAPMTSEATNETVAVEIRGQSMGVLFDGWFAYYDDVRHPPTEDLIGHLCIVGLADGRVLIKKLHQGRDRRFFDLLSQDPPIYSAEVIWAAKVKDLKPKS